MMCWVAYVLVLTLGAVAGLTNLNIKYKWKTVSITFPNQTVENSLIEGGNYSKNASRMFDVDVDPKTETVFVTMPKLYPGAPVTLATVSNKTLSDGSRELTPYPDWESNNMDSCDDLISVFRVKNDECGRMWVMDSGRVDIMSSYEQRCPPKLVVIDLATKKVVKRHRFPSETYMADSLFLTVAVEIINKQCQNAYAYCADAVEYGLNVYSLKDDRSWRVNANNFYPDPRWGTFHVAGSTFYLMDGVVGLALSPLVATNDRILYFHSLASTTECSVRTSILRNSSNFPDGQNLMQGEFLFSRGTRLSQAAAEDMDKYGNLYFSQVSQYSINSWNWNTVYDSYNIRQLVRDDVALQFISGIKLIPIKGRTELWAISNRYQKMADDTWNSTEYNFHIVSVDLLNVK